MKRPPAKAGTPTPRRLGKGAADSTRFTHFVALRTAVPRGVVRVPVPLRRRRGAAVSHRIAPRDHRPRVPARALAVPRSLRRAVSDEAAGPLRRDRAVRPAVWGRERGKRPAAVGVGRDTCRRADVRHVSARAGRKGRAVGRGVAAVLGAVARQGAERGNRHDARRLGHRGGRFVPPGARIREPGRRSGSRILDRRAVVRRGRNAHQVDRARVLLPHRDSAPGVARTTRPPVRPAAPRRGGRCGRGVRAVGARGGAAGRIRRADRNAPQGGRVPVRAEGE